MFVSKLLFWRVFICFHSRALVCETNLQSLWMTLRYILLNVHHLWLVVWNMSFIFLFSWECHHPIDELIFFRGVDLQPPSSNVMHCPPPWFFPVPLLWATALFFISRIAAIHFFALPIFSWQFFWQCSIPPGHGTWDPGVKVILGPATSHPYGKNYNHLTVLRSPGNHGQDSGNPHMVELFRLVIYPDHPRSKKIVKYDHLPRSPSHSSHPISEPPETSTKLFKQRWLVKTIEKP